METTLAAVVAQDLDALTRTATDRIRASVPDVRDGAVIERLGAALHTSFETFVRAWSEGRPLADDELETVTRWFDLSDEGPPRQVLLHAHRVAVDVVRDHIERRVGDLGVRLVAGPTAAMSLLKELGLARALERQMTAAVEALVTVRDRTYATERRRLEERILDALLGLPADVATARTLLRALGLGPGGPWTVVVLPAAVGPAAVRTALQAGGRAAAAVADRAEGTVVLVDDTPEGAATALAGEAVAGIGGAAATLADIRRSAEEATAALEVSAARGCGPVRADRADLDLLLLGAVTPTELVERVLAPLTGIDEARREWMLETLEAYLDAGTSVTATGRVLSLHRESVRYRVAQLRDLLGDDLDDPDRRLALHVAVKALSHRLARPARGRARVGE